jgi:MoxR-like ATPase
MAANDAALQSVFEGFAASSGGAFAFRSTTSAKLSAELGLELGRSTNPIYVFDVKAPGEPVQTFIAFTLALNGSGRPASRVEALGKSLAAADGKLFEKNPILLVYDYVGERMLAVSAVELFDAFAKEVKSKPIPFADSATFSLSPSFQQKTISMYATLKEPVVWEASTKPSDLTRDQFVAFLKRVAVSQAAKRGDLPAIVQAIKARLAATPASPSGGSAHSTVELPESIDIARVDSRDAELQVNDRVWQMILMGIASSAAVILVGPPGTGKSALLRKAVGEISTQRLARDLPGVRTPIWATPDESWTARDLIGGETIVNGEIVFRPGWVLRAIAEDRWLVLDEANRGDLDRIFGALLTWLSGGQVAVGVESTAADAKTIELGWTAGASQVEVQEGDSGRPRGVIRYLAGQDWRLLGTYNALDSQRVFRLGAALGRRFVRIPIPPIAPALFTQALDAHANDLSAPTRHKISLLYHAHFGDEATRLGPALFLGCARIYAAFTPLLTWLGQVSRTRSPNCQAAMKSRGRLTLHPAG